MSTFRIIPVVGLAVLSVVVFLVGFVWILASLGNPQYFGLRHKSAKYYVDLTAACDSVLVDHPPGTNEVVLIPVRDPSLPKIITDLHPIRIHVKRQHFWMLLGSDSREGFGLTWEPKWGDTNNWVLHTTAESVDTVIYVSRK